MIQVIAATSNPEGRLVVVHRRAWHHVLDHHPLMSAQLDTVMATIHAPAFREPDPRPGRERSYGHGGPFGWIRVITEFAGDHDRLVTAFPQRRAP